MRKAGGKEVFLFGGGGLSPHADIDELYLAPRPSSRIDFHTVRVQVWIGQLFLSPGLGEGYGPGVDIRRPPVQVSAANVYVPTKYRMDKTGLLLREDILDTAYVEELYITPRNFLFQMNKLSDERDLNEQRKENDTLPITLDLLETGVDGFDVRQALINEQGKVNHTQMTDLELCHVVDSQILPRYIRDGQPLSIYALPLERRAKICEGLWLESSQARYSSGRSQPGYVVSQGRSTHFLGGKTVTEKQLRRCLAICERN